MVDECVGGSDRVLRCVFGLYGLCSRTVALGEEVVGMLGIGVLAVVEGDGGTCLGVPFPLQRAAGVEEDGTVALPVGGHFVEVVLHFFYLTLLDHFSSVAIDLDFRGVAETSGRKHLRRELIDPSLIDIHLHPFAFGKHGVVGIARGVAVHAQCRSVGLSDADDGME